MKTNKKGFTLIELLVVIAIIGLLSTVVMVSLNRARAKARDARKMTDFRQIQSALEQYFDANGYYPYTVDCSATSDSGWVYDSGATGYTPDGIVLSWSDLETQLAPYIKLPKSPGSGSYSYGATQKDYKLSVSLETDTDKMLNDNGCYPRTGTSCTGLSYEVFNGLKGTARDWTCVKNMCYGF